MQFVLVLALVLSYTLAFDDTLNQQWKLWKETNDKRYVDAEEHLRRAIWESNLKKVQEHNLQADLGVYTYWLGMNKYADKTIDEFVKVMNGYKVTMGGERKQPGHTFTFNPSLTLPDTVDWRAKGYVTPVKDQGQCGAGYAFSATGAIEGQVFNASGKLFSLSEQQITDCSGMGCTGGLVDYAFAYINKTGGIEGEDSYPYDPSKCRFDPTKVAAKVNGFIDVTSRNEKALQQAVAAIGPISIAIDASHSSFQLYRSGIYNEPNCSPTRLDHSVLAVGYGTDSGKEYWLVKNSWGISWGDRGYIKMTRNKGNQCGVATMASYPLV